jgi:hypothetical protein
MYLASSGGAVRQAQGPELVEGRPQIRAWNKMCSEGKSLRREVLPRRANSYFARGCMGGQHGGEVVQE